MMIEKMKELEAKLAADETLAAKYKEAIKTAGEGGAKSDSEVISQAAAAVGMEITPEEVERSFAEAQKFSEEELESVTGGIVDPDFGDDDTEEVVDEYGHDGFCIAAWHCLTALRHTQTEEEGVCCWSDYSCAWIYH